MDSARQVAPLFSMPLGPRLPEFMKVARRANR